MSKALNGTTNSRSDGSAETIAARNAGCLLKFIGLDTLPLTTFVGVLGDPAAGPCLVTPYKIRGVVVAGRQAEGIVDRWALGEGIVAAVLLHTALIGRVFHRFAGIFLIAINFGVRFVGATGSGAGAMGMTDCGALEVGVPVQGTPCARLFETRIVVAIWVFATGSIQFHNFQPTKSVTFLHNRERVAVVGKCDPKTLSNLNSF